MYTYISRERDTERERERERERDYPYLGGFRIKTCWVLFGCL